MVSVSDYSDHYGGQYIQKRCRRINFNILRLTVAYLKATIYCKTRNAELEMATDGWSKIWQNLRVDG